MVSAVFDLRSLVFPPAEDLPFIVHLPTYAATAWYHEKIKKSDTNIEAFVDRVRKFTEDIYVPALYKGDQISEGEKANVARQLESLTGVSSSFWIKADLRVAAGEFFNELLREEGKTVGRLDSRYTGINQSLLDQSAEYDPQSAAISPAYITGFLQYFHTDLKVDPSHKYMTTAGLRKGFKWDWSHTGNSRWGTQAAITTSGDMAQALTRDPNMKVLILNGYYDIATVFYGVEHSIDHMGLAPEIKKNIIMKYYEAGHMMYTEPESLRQFKDDVEAFIDETK
jgi:carboxypeptidase C (cathepsin A)